MRMNAQKGIKMYVKDHEWYLYPNFQRHEFKCSHTGQAKMQHKFMQRLQRCREDCDFPFFINSGYRDPTHPIEQRKNEPGEHTYGLACDIAIYGAKARILIALAIEAGFPRIGIKQHGTVSSRFVHLGLAKVEDGFVSPTVWTYPN